MAMLIQNGVDTQDVFGMRRRQVLLKAYVNAISERNEQHFDGGSWNVNASLCREKSGTKSTEWKIGCFPFK